MSKKRVFGRNKLRGLGKELIRLAFRAGGNRKSDCTNMFSGFVSFAKPRLHDALRPYNDLDLLEKHSVTLLNLVISRASENEWKHWLGSLMKQAASTGATDVLIRLLESWEHSVDDGTLPLGVLQAAREGGSVEVLSALLAAGAGSLVGEVGRFSKALNRAAKEGNRNFVTKLIAVGTPVDSWDFLSGGTALKLAVQGGHKGVALELLAAGADVNKTVDTRCHRRCGIAAEHGDFTPLGIAVDKNDEEMVKVLLEAGADPSKGPKGFIPLHMAASLGSCASINSLLLAGASVSLVDTKGRSALHHACAYNEPGAVNLLLRHNASVTLLCNNGLSPVDVVGTYVLALRQRSPLPLRRAYGRIASYPSTLNSAETSTVDTICDMLQSASAWGRRGWLIMMRARPLAEVVVEQPDHSDADALTTSVLAIRLVHEPSSNTADVCEDGRTPRALYDGGHVRTDWRAAVVWMLRGADESLFCNIVRFL